MVEITHNRMNPFIDPDLHIWHGEVAAYLFLGGLAAGVMLLTGLLRIWKPKLDRSRQLALIPWLAPILISLGMFFLWLDLGNRINAFRFFFTFKVWSPMSWGAWILLLIYPSSILFSWSETPRDIRDRLIQRFSLLGTLDRWTSSRRDTLAFWSMGVGMLLGIYTGVLLGSVAARPLWNSALLGPLFLVSGISTAAALTLLFKIRDEERVIFSRIDMVFILVEMAFLALWLITLASGGASYQAAAELFWGGSYTAAFWSLVVALGLVVPLAAEWLEKRHQVIPGRAAAILVLIGGFALRWILVFAGQNSSWVTQLSSH
jgi:protein NrfD